MHTLNISAKRIFTALVLLVFILLIPKESQAQGDLLITPRRIVFDGSSRVMDISLANIGTDTATYNVSFIQYRMNEDGSFTEVTEPDPGQRFADGNLRFFPRRVTLPPNDAQMIKMQVTGLNNLEPGEYRSHVYFRAVPLATALGDELVSTDTTELSIQLIPVFGISIPAIIRVGTSTTSATISDMLLETTEESTKRLSLTINREGNMSLYGDLKVVHISPSNKETTVSAVNGLAVYTPNSLRKITVDLDPTQEVDYSLGKLVITFIGQSQTKPEKYAETVMNLP